MDKKAKAELLLKAIAELNKTKEAEYRECLIKELLLLLIIDFK